MSGNGAGFPSVPIGCSANYHEILTGRRKINVNQFLW
jgi:hypothetical protein